MPYRTYAVTFDMNGRTDGDLNDFVRALNALEVEYPGAQLLGSNWTERWPTFVVRETRATPAEPEESHNE